MVFLIVIGVGLAVITIQALSFRDSRLKAHYREIGERITLELMKLFYDIYPGYIEDGRMEFRSFCRRKWFAWGTWRIDIETEFDETMNVVVAEMATERITRVFERNYSRERVLLQPIFISRQPKKGPRTDLPVKEKENTMTALIEEEPAEVAVIAEVSSDHPAPDPEREDYSYLVDEFDLDQNPARVTWLCFGGGAKNFLTLLLDVIDPIKHPFTRILVANTDIQQFREMINSPMKPKFFGEWAQLVKGKAKDCWFKIVKLGIQGGTGGDPEIAKTEVKKCEAVIKASFEDASISVLVANLGGGTGSGAAPEVARYMAEKKATMGGLALHMMPFASEGEGRFDVAQTAHKAVVEAGIAAVTFRNQALLELENNPRYKTLSEQVRGASTDEAIAIMNRHVIAPTMYAIDQLVAHAASSVNRDPSDLRRIFQSGKAGYISWYDSTAEGASTDLENIITELLNNPFLARGIIGNSKLGMILFRGFTLADTNVIATRVNSAMKNGDAEKSITLMPGHDRGEDGQRAVIFLCVAEEEVNFEEIKNGDRPSAQTIPLTATAESTEPNMDTPKLPLLSEELTTSTPTITETLVLTEEVAPLAPVEPEELVPIVIGLKGPAREIEVAERSLPYSLAEEVQNFRRDFKKATLQDRDQAWKGLCARVGPHLNGREMAELQSLRFLTETCASKVWHLTPTLRARYRDLEKRCKNRVGTIEEALAEFQSLSAEWKEETGFGLHFTTSRIFEQALTVTAKPSGWTALIKAAATQLVT